MTKPQLEQVNAELLAACEAALQRLHDYGPFENQELRVQLSAAISRAKTDPKKWFLLDIPKTEMTPAQADALFARFKD